MTQYRVFLGGPSRAETRKSLACSYQWQTVSSNTSPATSVIFPPATLEAASRRISLIYQNIIFKESDEEQEIEHEWSKSSCYLLISGSLKAGLPKIEQQSLRGHPQQLKTQWKAAQEKADLQLSVVQLSLLLVLSYLYVRPRKQRRTTTPTRLLLADSHPSILACIRSCRYPLCLLFRRMGKVLEWSPSWLQLSRSKVLILSQ